VRYEVRLSNEELRSLRRLLGTTIRAVTTDGWSIQVFTSEGSLQFEPEEVSTPDRDHPHGDVTRPRLMEAAAQHTGATPLKPVAVNLGVVREIRIHSTRASFEPPREEQAIAFPNGAVLSPGIGYGLVLSLPGPQRSAPPEHVAVVYLDIGVELLTEAGASVLIYTTGIGFFVHVLVRDSAGASTLAHVPPPAEVEITKLELANKTLQLTQPSVAPSWRGTVWR